MAYLIAISMSLLVAAFVPRLIEENRHRTFLLVKQPWYKDTKKWQLIGLVSLSALPILLISCFRYGVGTDYFHTYVPQFLSIVNGSYTHYYEPGFYLLNLLVASLTSDPQWLIALCALLTLGLVYVVTVFLSDNYFMSILLFYLTYTYFVSINNIRQALALAILLPALYFLVRKKKIAFVLLTILAGTMHQSAYYFLIMAVLDLLPLSQLSYLLINLGFYIFIKLLGKRILALLALLIPRVQMYLNQGVYLGKTIGKLYLGVQIAISLIYLYLEYQQRFNRDLTQFSYNKSSFKSQLVGMLQLDDRQKLGNSAEEWTIAKLLQWMVLIVCAMDGILPATYRVVRIFTYAQFIFIPNAISKFERDDKRRLILYILVIVIFGILFVHDFAMGFEQVYPYKSIFNR